MRAKDFITEAFDRPYAFNWSRGDHGDYDISVKLPDGSPLNIAFIHEGDNVWHVAFDRGHSQDITGEGDAQRIFATVLTSIQQFIIKQDPDRLYFSASKDVEHGQNPESRARLYERMVHRYAAAMGYDVVVDDRRGHAMFILDKEQSLAEQSTHEDRHPNDTPYGPETKPTMPKGTVRVDVSDVYDWYKLGMHISDLDGLGKHDFGKGPPSTIFSFGDEETEHKYIKDLEKTGLTTTDIDPKDPNQPKGMPRQKVDPTFNVNEEEFNGIDITMDVEGDEIMVTATGNGRELGHVLFVDQGEYLMPQDLEVDERFQGQGIAAAMYDYVKSKGYKIRRSGQQTDAGAGFWGKHRPDQNVWEDASSKPTMGINVRSDGDIDYASLIIDGRKKYESRQTDSLRPYVGKTVAIVRTGKGSAVAIGQVTVGEPVVVDAEKFDKMRDQHLVPQGSKFDIDPGATKYLYPMIDPVRWDSEKLVKQKGIVARKIDDLDENFADGKVKGKSRPGRVKRAGASCNGSVTDLRARAKKASGELAKMYHWCANMKSGRKK
jgi:GNAT superfamily N-acetyltransferase